MLKTAFAVACVIGLSSGVAFAQEQDPVPPQILQDTTMSNAQGVKVRITCTADLCKVRSLKRGATVWDREDSPDAGPGVFEGLLTKYAESGFY